MKPEKITVLGVEYPSFAAAARAHGIKPETVRQRLRRNWTIDDAFTADKVDLATAGARGRKKSGWGKGWRI